MSDSHAISRLRDCRIVRLRRHTHENGSLSVVENTAEYPFEVRRVFYLYDIPGDSERGGHSHHEAQELIIAASGSFDVTITDGHETRRVQLNRPYNALYIPAGVWRNLDNFSSGSVCLVLTSLPYSEEDYVRDYDRFKRLTAVKTPIDEQ
ncbi:MAG: FdtA/QdtA family cupin domain-containing protein [Pseudoflavonifractor sp.]|nr:FdtA/QdtA family cupin domain-containing protein [Pseudoflavonifractor sp.]